MRQFHLDNGVQVIFVRSPGQLAAVTGMISAGSRHDPPDCIGLTHALEHVMSRLTKQYPEWKKFQTYVEGFCTSFDATTDGLRMYFQAETEPYKIGQAIKLIASVIKEPVITTENVRAEHGRLKVERLMANDSSDDWTNEQMDALSLPPDLGHSIDGPISVIEQYTPQRLRQLYNKIVVGKRLTVIITGNFNPVVAERIIRHEFGSIRPGQPAPVVRTSHRRVTRAIRLKVDQTCTQVQCLVLFPTMTYDDPDRFALEVMRNQFSQRRSSCVGTTIDGQGLVYTSSDFLEYFPGIVGQYGVRLELEPENFLPTLRELARQIEDLCLNLMSSEDLETSKSNIRRVAKKHFGQPMKAGDFIGRQILAAGAFLPVDDFVQHIRQVTRQRVRKVSQRVFTKPIVVAYGPLRGIKKKDIREALRFRKRKK